MIHRENVSIKTKYETREECIENLVDHNKKTYLSLFLRQISGHMNQEGEFEVSSRYNAGAFFEFNGKVAEDDDGIYLKGDIRVKKFIKVFTILCTIMVFVVSPVYIIAWKSFGIFFMIFILVDIGVLWAQLKYSDALYQDILRKVS